MVLTWHICWSHLGVRWKGYLLLSGSACVCDFQLTSTEQGMYLGEGILHFFPVFLASRKKCEMPLLLPKACPSCCEGNNAGWPQEVRAQVCAGAGTPPRRPTLPACASRWCQMGRLKTSGFSPAPCTEKEGSGNGDHPRALPGTSVDPCVVDWSRLWV